MNSRGLHSIAESKCRSHDDSSTYSQWWLTGVRPRMKYYFYSEISCVIHELWNWWSDDVCVFVCVALTCAFVWNTVAFEVSWAHLTGSVRLRHTFLTTLPLLLLRPLSYPLPVFALLLVFMLFRLLPGLVVAGWWTLVPGALQDSVSRRWCADAGRGEHCWARE